MRLRITLGKAQQVDPGKGRIEILFQQIQRYTDRRMPCVTNLSAGTALGPEKEKEAFDDLRTTYAEQADLRRGNHGS